MNPLESTVVIVPALNEEASIALVLRDLPPVQEVIVVDNGSTDRTGDRARGEGALVVHEPRRGYGQACLRGMQAIEQLPNAPKFVAFADADYSDHVHLLPDLVRPLASDEYDFVLGSRSLGEREPGAMPPQSRWGNRLACFLMSWTVGHVYTDLGPFRAIRYSSLLALRMVDTNYGWTVEMQIKAARANLRIRELPTPYRRRVGASKISGTVSGTIKAGSKILWLIFKYALLPLRSNSRLTNSLVSAR